ncbi:unnamed protein product [Angiostrongylus costaricensis]|uniref:DUF4773 domain-containing protein n=1 Tax=Angiostrongylus costaricensis TaxID=334426 RepID=A0A0R3PNG9_ANGCS|nr:unnamed protein product [Angiostrongylus costaricensis]
MVKKHIFFKKEFNKVFCRQGRRYSHEVQTTTQCPSSTTACGFFEFKSPDLERGVDNIGVYECVDNGILQTNANDVNEDNFKLFTQLCGATPQCSHLNLNKLNTVFVKYLFVHHNIQLELLTSHTIRFCCSLFHHTLQKLVTSGKDRLPSIPAPPIHCESEICEEDAVGCLLHSLAANEESDEYYDDDDDNHGNDHGNNYGRRESVRQKRQHEEHRVEEDEGIDAVQLFFDFEEEEHDPSLQFVTRVPSPSPSSTTALRQVGVSRLTPSPFLKASPADRSQTTPAALSNTPGEHIDDYEELDDMDDVHCVYRHLNDELYRYCLLVHQGKDGDSFQKGSEKELIRDYNSDLFSSQIALSSFEIKEYGLIVLPQERGPTPEPCQETCETCETCALLTERLNGAF